MSLVLGSNYEGNDLISTYLFRQVVQALHSLAIKLLPTLDICLLRGHPMLGHLRDIRDLEYPILQSSIIEIASSAVSVICLTTSTGTRACLAGINTKVTGYVVRESPSKQTHLLAAVSLVTNLLS
jgi:hypothetical protein